MDSAVAEQLAHEAAKNQADRWAAAQTGLAAGQLWVDWNTIYNAIFFDILSRIEDDPDRPKVRA